MHSLAEQADLHDLQTTLAKRLYASLRSMDWSTADVFWYSIGPDGQSGWVVTHDEQGRIGYPEYPVLDFEMLTALKRLMADPVRGTWFSVSFTVTKQGRFTFSYNYDRRVYGATTTPTPFDEPSHRTSIEDQDWLAEFELYPRAPEHVPAFVATLVPAAPIVVDEGALHVALDAMIVLPADLADLATADGWGDAIVAVADAAKRRLGLKGYPELLQSPYSNDWPRSEDALMEDVYSDALAATLPQAKATDAVPRLYASLRAAGLGAEVRGDARAMRREVVSVLDRLVEADVLGRLAAIGRK